MRVLANRSDIEVVGINDLADAKMMATLFKYDSTHGVFEGTVAAAENALVINGRKIPLSKEKDPSKLPWGSLGAYFVLESTGFFTKREQCMMHVQAGAKKVLLSAPAKDEIDATIVMGVNQNTLKATDIVISNASCTTNCLAPMAKVLSDNFGIEKGLMTTCHAYTNDQRIQDLIHEDPRRARAGAINIIPTKTGAAKAIGEVIPELKGKLDGLALRVPVVDGSITDLVCLLRDSTTKEEINAALKKAAEGPMKGILEYTEDPIVSTDVIGNTHSSIIDGQCTTVVGGNLAKVLSWYDNEMGFSNRVADLIAYAAKL
jgi:glyceraldehyde 3-phosphate dehydrogenase